MLLDVPNSLPMLPEREDENTMTNQSKVIIADITSIMGRKPAGERALTNAEKQRHCQQSLSATKNNS